MIKKIISNKHIIFYCMNLIFVFSSCDTPVDTENNYTIIDSPNCISMVYNSEVNISGFQFNHNACIDSAYGGQAAANGFNILYSDSVVLGFSFSGLAISSGTGILLNLSSEDETINLDCISDIIISDEDGHNVYNNQMITFEECADISVMSWNIENFPKSGHNTIDHASDLIHSLEPDIVGLQEMPSDITSEALTILSEKLNLYDFVIEENEVMSTLFFYKENSNLEFISATEIYNNDYDFPRSPLILTMLWNGDSLYIINNHFKCCDDDGDFERRQQAGIKLHEYVANNLSNKKVIIIGDLNDSLTDTESENAFTIFLEDQTNYIIADMNIAQGHSDYWSYPGYPSHIDHIFLSTELSASFNKESSTIETVLIDLNFNSWDDYDAMVSDHRPILIRLSY